MYADKPDITRLIELQRFLLQFQAVERADYVPPGFRPENDTEHSYNLAMTAWFLAGHFSELDRNIVIQFALVHDLVETYAGDTPLYAQPTTWTTKEEREAAALKQLEQAWADFPDMITAIHRYEKRDTSEARFVYALDKIMPIFMNIIGEGHGWQRHQVTRERMHEAKRHKVALSPEIDEYYQALLKLLEEQPHFFPRA